METRVHVIDAVTKDIDPGEVWGAFATYRRNIRLG